jgi:hypothetical protein
MRRQTTVAVLAITLASGFVLLSLIASPAHVSKRLFELSTAPRWKAQKPLIVPTDCPLRSDLDPRERLRLADALDRSVNGYRLAVWQSELERIAEEASLGERLNVMVRNEADALLDRAEDRMARLEPVDRLTAIEQRLAAC